VQPSDKPRDLPESPGVYQFLEGGRIIYVGKAKNLRSRLNSYFAAPESLATRTASMVARADEVKWLELPSDADALVTEARLIDTHRPVFNVRFEDDTTFPYVVIESTPVARVSVTRRPPKHGQRFGPFPKTPNLHGLIDVLAGQLGVATCTPQTFRRARATKRPCLLFDLGRCPGPCANDVPDYSQRVQNLVDVLSGRGQVVKKSLGAELTKASDEQRYEAAAELRDALRALETLDEAPVVAGKTLAADLVAISPGTGFAAVVWVRVRKGRVTGYDALYVTDLPVETEGEELTELIVSSLYAKEVPANTVVLAGASETLVAALSERAGRAVKVVTPKRGALAELMVTSTATAEHNRDRRLLHRASSLDTRSAALSELGAALGILPPLRLECYDTAHTQGVYYTASMVVFVDGLSVKGQYRTFALRDTPGNNDLAAMRETLSRRLARLVDTSGTDTSFRARPDLLVIDGGREQLAVVVDVLRGLELAIPVVGLAKRNEELWRPGFEEPLVLARDSEALYLLQRLRDEAHRVANGRHAKKRGKAMTASALSVPGVGPARQTRLMERFGNMTGVLQASADELSEVVGAAPAQRLFLSLHPLVAE
jgi:excinuclease ABC subunit C